MLVRSPSPQIGRDIVTGYNEGAFIKDWKIFMRIEQITIEQYEKFIEDSQLGFVFLQIPSYAKLYDRFILAGINDENRITHAVIVEPKPAMKMWKFAYTAGGFLSDDRAHDADFLQEASEYLKKEGFILWRIESSVEVKEYDREGAVVEGGFDNTKEHLALAEKNGFHWHESPLGTDTSHQITWQSVVELKDGINQHHKGYQGKLTPEIPNRDIADIDKLMSGSSRKYTHKAEREGFTLTIKNPSEMEEQDWADIEGMLDKSGEYKNFDTGSSEKRRDLASVSDGYCKLVKVHNADGQLVYGGYWYVTNMEMLCYFGGIDRSAVRYNLSGFIHHEMYKHALELGLERYNYGGISGYFEKGQDGYGSFFFKRELGATVVRTFGIFDKPLNAMGKIFEQRLNK